MGARVGVTERDLWDTDKLAVNKLRALFQTAIEANPHRDASGLAEVRDSILPPIKLELRGAVPAPMEIIANHDHYVDRRMNLCSIYLQHWLNLSYPQDYIRGRSIDAIKRAYDSWLKAWRRRRKSKEAGVSRKRCGK